MITKPLKYPTPEKRREMWNKFCDHIAAGYSIKSFPECDYDTAYSYAKRFPEDCPMEEFNEAQRKSLLYWETMGAEGASGKIPGFNATSWIFNMKNRAGWVDKLETVNETKITFETRLLNVIGGSVIDVAGTGNAKEISNGPSILLPERIEDSNEIGRDSTTIEPEQSAVISTQPSGSTKETDW